jgi:hypothetical protein
VVAEVLTLVAELVDMLTKVAVLLVLEKVVQELLFFVIQQHLFQIL